MDVICCFRYFLQKNRDLSLQQIKSLHVFRAEFKE